MGKLEKAFQRDLIKDLKIMMPDCMVIKMDPTYIQGIPDLLILNNDKWAALECKRNEGSSSRPNQNYYITKMNGMSYASFIYPENKEVVLNEIQHALQP